MPDGRTEQFPKALSKNLRSTLWLHAYLQRTLLVTAKLLSEQGWRQGQLSMPVVHALWRRIPVTGERNATTCPCGSRFSASWGPTRRRHV